MLTGLNTDWKYGSSYTDDRDYIIKLRENAPLMNGGSDKNAVGIHLDSDNNPALGYGYDLNSKSISAILSDFASVGLIISSQNETYLRQYKAGSLSKSDLIAQSTLSISQTQATSLLHKIMPTYESQVDRLLGYTMQNSRERAALVSLAYNGALVSSTSLIRNINNDNRAEAWFEIRYRTNDEKLLGVATRRVLESDLFSLYDAGGVTDASAKEIMRMYTLKKNRDKINLEESKYPTAYKGSSSIINQIKQANQYLQGLYGNGQGGGELIEGGGGVITGAGVAYTYEYMDVVLDDTVLEGTNQNDLALLGEGNDLFHSSIGDDIIYGGTGVDNLFGDSGDDFLIGNEGTDYLFGGDDNDTLFGMDGFGTLDKGEVDYLDGGAGFDTYIAGDGDIVSDSDGKGEVYFEGFKLTGGTFASESGGFKTYEGDGGMYILRSDGVLIFSKNGNFLTINNYHKENNDLGIVLQGGELELSIFAPVVKENVGVATGAVTLAQAYSEDIIITMYTQDDTAIAGSDYVGRPTFDVRIPAGETYVTFDISILDNQEAEPTETFYTLVDTVRTVNGAHVDFTLTDVQAFTIEDDDSDDGDNPDDPNNPTDPKYVTISVSDAQAVESGGTISFVVSLSEVLSKDVSIDFITQDGTAVTGSDYVQYGRYGVTIPAGSRSAVYQVVLLNDEVPEPIETFSLTPYSLSYTGPENVLFSNSATGTIYDDDDPEYVSVHISDASAVERSEHMTFTVSISHELDTDITITTSLGAVTIKQGERSAPLYSSWQNDSIVEPDVAFEVVPKGHSYTGSKYKVLLINTATGTIIDDDPEDNPNPIPYDPTRPGMHDPLALDMNQDGQISTISLADSQVYFDLTGDGVKEKVGWIQAVDGLVAYDKNHNGTIDGISEVFGKEGISGFAELRQVADSNYDGIIDRRDELYSQLKVWQDLNQDGISQANELKTLSEAGVKNIELNVIGTNINLNGNILSEAGRYGDSAGERELAADIQLLALEKVNSNPNSTAPSSIDPITELFPLLRGYGYVEDSFQAYNLDPNFKALTQRLMQDKNEVSSNFEEFIAYWSGFYTVAQSKGISHDEFSPKVFNMVPDIKMWILERFAGAKVDSWRSEAHWPESLNGAYHHTTFQDEAYINEQFEALVDRFRAVFSVQAFYSDVFSDVHYDITIDEFVIDDTAAFTTKLTDYFNSATVNESDKLYLASTISVLEGIFLHIDGKAVIDTIEDTALKNRIFDIRNNVGRFEMANGSGIYLHDGTSVYGTVSNDKLVINSNITLSMTADKGDDILVANNKNFKNKKAVA